MELNMQKMSGTASDSQPKLSACCDDDMKRYSKQQDRWQQFSKETIEQFKTKLPEFKSFAEAFVFLGKRRQQIAKELHHGTKHAERHKHPSNDEHFGSFCSEKLRNFETIMHGKKTRYSKQRPHIINALIALTKLSSEERGNHFKMESDEQKNDGITFHGYNFTFAIPKLPKRDEAYDECIIKSILTVIDKEHRTNLLLRNNNIMSECIQSPNSIESSRNLSSITLFKPKNKDDDHYSVVLSYPGYNKYDLIGDYLIAQLLFDELINWQANKGIESFLKTSGKLSHFLAHRLFVRRGTAAMTEWLIRGIAEYKGIELGEFKANDLGWCWKALVSPNPDEYASWYQKNVFSLTSSQDQKNESVKIDLSKSNEPQDYHSTGNRYLISQPTPKTDSDNSTEINELEKNLSDMNIRPSMSG